MIRNFLFPVMLVPMLLIASCNDNDEDSPAKVTIDKKQLSQTAYADEADKTISFQAAKAWRTEVNYSTTKAGGNAEQWITLDPPSGEAGEVTIKVSLDVNTTGKDRQATISIICGGTTVTVVIEQKAETSSGEALQRKKLVASVAIHTVKHWVESDDESDELYTFSYDNRNRLTEQRYKDNNNIEWLHQFSYSGSNEVKVKYTEVRNDYEEENWVLTLNEKGAVTRLEAENTYTEDHDVYNLAYDAEGYLVKETREDSHVVSHSVDYTFKNGNFDISVHKSETGWIDTLQHGYTYLTEPVNNLLNIDPNMFISSLGATNYSANSNKYDNRKGRLDLLALWGLTGERSKGYVSQYKTGDMGYPVLPDQEYYYYGSHTYYPLEYEFNPDKSLKQIRDKEDVHIYKYVVSTEESILIKEVTNMTTYTFTYKN